MSLLFKPAWVSVPLDSYLSRSLVTFGPSLITEHQQGAIGGCRIGALTHWGNKIQDTEICETLMAVHIKRDTGSRSPVAFQTATDETHLNPIIARTMLFRFFLPGGVGISR